MHREESDPNSNESPVGFSCEGSQFIDIDESEMTPSHIEESFWQYLEKKYGRPRGNPTVNPHRR